MLTTDEERRFAARRVARRTAEMHDVAQAAMLVADIALALPEELGDEHHREPIAHEALSPDTIVGRTASLMRVWPDEFRGRSRLRRLVFARTIAAGLCRELTTASYPDIARAMGRPTHSSVIAMVRRLPACMEERIDHDSTAPTVGEMYERCRAAVAALREAAA